MTIGVVSDGLWSRIGNMGRPFPIRVLASRAACVGCRCAVAAERAMFAFGRDGRGGCREDRDMARGGSDARSLPMRIGQIRGRFAGSELRDLSLRKLQTAMFGSDDDLRRRG